MHYLTVAMCLVKPVSKLSSYAWLGVQAIPEPRDWAMLWRRKGSCAQSSVLWVRWASKGFLPLSVSSATRQENLFPCTLYQKMKEQKKSFTHTHLPVRVYAPVSEPRESSSSVQ